MTTNLTVLVTGAAGFIGSHLAAALQDHGHTVVAADKRHGSATTNLATFLETLEISEPDVIAHLGASCSTSRSLTDPAADFHDNAIGTFNIAEAARQAGGIPVLFTSTVKVHPGPDGLIAPLGQSKLVGEQYLRLYSDLYDVPSVILRPSTVYGPGQDGSPEAGWVTWFLRAAREGRPITIHGDGTQSRDILHIGDMTRLLVDIVENYTAYQGRTFEVGGGPENEVSLLDLLRWLETAYGVPAQVVHGERLPGDLQRVVTDNTEISAVRDWEPAIPWKAGVLATYDTWTRRQP
ncbi:NAD-dependent epimerase/dehydratase family protein [Streptomyces sp. NPDC051997]|uniref:NAD-dependent epimerase/dehydratase family protein n=1 Tax=Streptomyces sp. NPDC051997 TaxID=3155611 RepID=UPI00341342D0